MVVDAVSATVAVALFALVAAVASSLVTPEMATLMLSWQLQ